MQFKTDSATVWEEEGVKERLSWYRNVMNNVLPAKFIICKSILSEDVNHLDEGALWILHDQLRQEYLEDLKQIVKGTKSKDSIKGVKPNFLDVKVALAERIVSHCHFCEWKCKVDRKAGQKGFCRVGYSSRVATWFHHFGEEAPLIGSGGSGTIFFSGCNFGPCVFCQNWDISSDPENGAEVTPMTLSSMSKELGEGKAANINYVGGEPTPNLHNILRSLTNLNVNVPQLWNSNMYCSIEAMKLLSEVVDIWLPDFKYGNDTCAKNLSKVDKYFEVISRNHKIAHDNGDIIIRHLVLPGHIECCTKPTLKWISQHLPRALVNIMNQYHPDFLVESNPEKYKSIARRVSSSEIMEAFSYADELKIFYKPIS